MAKKIILSVLILPIIILEIILFGMLFTEQVDASTNIVNISYDRKLYNTIESIPLPKSFVRWEINENIDSFNYIEFVQFYDQFTNDRAITESIINAALVEDVPINLSFALAWKESKFDPMSWHHNYGNSYDRGLYQLNNTYRQHWSKDDFYNLAMNSLEGNSYLSYCLKLSDGDVEKALYGYNAGPDAILEGNVPTRSIGYAIEIMDYEGYLTVEFNKRFGG